MISDGLLSMTRIISENQGGAVHGVLLVVGADDLFGQPSTLINSQLGIQSKDLTLKIIKYLCGTFGSSITPNPPQKIK